MSCHGCHLKFCTTATQSAPIPNDAHHDAKHLGCALIGTLAAAMSLFKARDWWSTTSGYEEFHDIGSLCVANVDNSPSGHGEGCMMGDERESTMTHLASPVHDSHEGNPGYLGCTVVMYVT